MNKLFISKKVLLLVLILTGITFGVALISTLIVYRTSIESKKESLVDIAISEKILIQTLYNQGFSRDSILNAIKSTQITIQNIEKTEEFVIAELVNDSVNFISGIEISGNIPINKITANSMYSRPIRLAIKGNSSSINGTDYRGNEVYAGFTYFEPLKWVIIAKINTKEVSKTYYFSIIIALILALVFIFLGAFLFIKITNPMLNSVIKSEEKLVVTLNSIGDGVISTDENGLIEGMNPVAAKLCGWNKTDAIGKQLTEVFNIFNSDTRLPATDLVKTVIERGISVDLANHTLLISKENMEYQISNSAAPIKDKDGKIVGVVLIFSDVTSKYDTESALISSERRYRRLFESAKDGILILDAETGMIQDVNPFLIDLLGYSKENFIEKAIWEIGFFKDIVANQDKFLELQQKEYARYEDLPLETADGRKINVEFVSNVYPVNNHKVIQCNIRDITKRKQAEKEIEVLSRFPGENPNPVLRLSKDSILLYANKAAEELVNFCGCSIGHIAPQFMCDMIKEVISQDSCTIFEKQFGSKMWLMTIAPVIEAGYVNIYCSDITERLQAEEAFKESQDFLDKIIQTSGDPIFVKDREHCWVLINEAFCRFIGHNKEQLIGKSDYEFFPKCEADEFWEKDEIVFKNGLENLNEESFTDASGFQHIIQTKKNLYTDFAGNQYLIGIIRDITELKHIEQELRENESKFRNYVNFAPHGIFIADKDGNYIEVNSAASKITGYSKDELLTMNLIDLVSEESMEIAGDQFGNVVNNGFSSGEFAFVKKDGSKGFWSVDAVKLTDDRFLGFVVDITERKKAEQELIVAKYHAEESDKLKTAFLQNMSHEIRTPLNGIIGFSDLLNEENLSGEDIKEFTSMIKQSGKRLLEIVNNVLDISKIQTGQVKIDLRPISINSIFSDLFTFFSLLAKAKNIKLNCYINPDNSQFQVLTDEAKLFQILTNLINNAIKFTESGSIDFGYNIKDDIIQFFVKDTGLGLSYDVFDRIFERFTQIDNSISRGYEGAGLGLAICKGLVEMLEGKIWLESEINKGTTFFFTLPYRPFEQPLQTIINKPERSRKLSNGKILIAEDDWTSFQYLNKILIKSDIAVIHAENGEQTVEFVKNMPDIDLILMDIRMPVMDGIDATKLIKQIRPDLPIIAQTAYAFSEERRMILSIGCDEYLAKPINKDKINALIIKYIR